jgi:hypothetical protein
MQPFNYGYQSDYEFEYANERGPSEQPRSYRRRRVSYRRGGSRPVRVNGMHRRRHKRIQW